MSSSSATSKLALPAAEATDLEPADCDELGLVGLVGPVPGPPPGISLGILRFLSLSHSPWLG